VEAGFPYEADAALEEHEILPKGSPSPEAARAEQEQRIVPLDAISDAFIALGFLPPAGAPPLETVAPDSSSLTDTEVDAGRTELSKLAATEVDADAKLVVDKPKFLSDFWL